MGSEEVMISRGATVTITVSFAEQDGEVFQHSATHQLPHTYVAYDRPGGATRWKKTVLTADAADLMRRAIKDSKELAVTQYESVMEARGEALGFSPPPMISSGHRHKP
jgi:hypothetical protein